jgi:hypothetical protein
VAPGARSLATADDVRRFFLEDLGRFVSRTHAWAQYADAVQRMAGVARRRREKSGTST